MTEKVILLVEDNPSDVTLTRRALAKRQIEAQLVVVNDGQEALDYLFREGDFAERSGDLPTVVLLDLNLPRLDGLSVLKALRADPRTALLPVIVLTTSQQEEDLVESYKVGANSYIRKPVDFLQFTEAVGALGVYWLALNQPVPQNR